MNNAVYVEWLKLRRATISRVIAASVVLAIPLMSFGLFWASVNGGFGPLAAKSEGLVVGDGWDGYLNATGQIASVAIFLAIGIGTAWVFGREHVDRTFPSLFSLATPRTAIANAKFAVVGLWSVALGVAFVATTWLVGFVAGVEPGTGSVINGLFSLLGIAVLASLLGMTTAFVASTGRGYLSAIGAVIGVVAVAQIAVLFGTGGWFPFAVPGLLAVSAAPGMPSVTGAQIALVPLLLVFVIAATVRWWKQAEAVA